MPTILSIEEVKLEWDDITKRVLHPTQDTEHRASGVHLSGIIRKVAVATGKLRLGQRSEEEFPLRMALGMAFENWVVGLYPDMIWQPGEQYLDGISGNPDGMSVLEISPGYSFLVVEEFKLTWKSRKEDILGEWMWLTQTCGYANFLGARHARLHVCWVNDNYKPSQPTYYRYLVEWTEEEILKNWTMMLQNREGTKEE